jgi:hypothetical protein
MRKRRRQPSAAERWAARTRDMRILDALKRGAPMAAIADQEGLTLRRIRTIVNALLAENLGLEPASGFAQAQMRRLDAALRAALRALGHGEASSVERLLRVVREFERYSEIAEPSATERSPRRARENQKAETLGEPKD